jgi:hypothetical protein
MKAKLGAVVVTLFVVAIAVASTDAAGSRPAAGDWGGSFKTKPAKPLTFIVTGSGHKRVVTKFTSSGSVDAGCSGADGGPNINGLPNATVTASGTFKTRGKEDSGFGTETWTVSGKFKGGHATGTVAIDLFLSPTKKCDYTVKWSAAMQAPAHPKSGATYKGKETVSTETVRFTISASGKDMTTITWARPLISGNCPGIGTGEVILTGHNVPIHGSKFSDTARAGKISHGSGTVTTDTISGEFLAGHKASGSVTTSADISGIGTACQGSDTWSATG